jgi:hypothetical protein
MPQLKHFNQQINDVSGRKRLIFGFIECIQIVGFSFDFNLIVDGMLFLRKISHLMLNGFFQILKTNSLIFLHSSIQLLAFFPNALYIDCLLLLRIWQISLLNKVVDVHDSWFVVPAEKCQLSKPQHADLNNVYSS